MDPKFIILSFVIVLCASYVAAKDDSADKNQPEKVIFCYYASWAVYRTGYGKVSASDIDPFICTHILYTFVGTLANGTVYSLDPYADLADGLDGFNKLNALKKVNPKLKTILSVGGWNEGSANYSSMAGNSTYRQTFIKTALEFIENYGFDGFDIDWEYPAQRDTVNGDADIENYSTLLKETKEAFEPKGYLLTAAVASVESSASLSYNISEISKYLDYINVMTYDMHVATENVTGYNSPLYGSAGDADADPSTLFTADAAIKYWLSQGAPAEKLLLGLPFYGHSFNLTDANQTLVGSPSSGPGIAGPYTASAGIIGYNELCLLLQNETLGWTVFLDGLAKVPYAVQGNNWVSYDGPISITKKVKYAVEQNLGGVMLWSIETDDIYAQCGESWPLLKALNTAIGRDYEAISNSTTTTTTTTESTSTTTTEDATETTETTDETTEDGSETTTEAASTTTTTEADTETTEATDETTEADETTTAESTTIEATETTTETAETTTEAAETTTETDETTTTEASSSS